MTKEAESAIRLSLRVHVDRSLSPYEVLRLTGLTPFVEESVVKDMPRGAGEEVEVIFFQVPGQGKMDDHELENEYAKEGLKPADPYSLAAVNAANPHFLETHRNITHWADRSGSWCFMYFAEWKPEDSGYTDEQVDYMEFLSSPILIQRRTRSVDVGYNADRYPRSLWFAGLRK